MIAEIVGSLAGTGVIIWLVDKAYDRWRARERRTALRFVFEGRHRQPFYIELSDWHGDNMFTRQLFCIGVVNRFDEPLAVRVIVEEALDVIRSRPPGRPTVGHR